MSAPFHEIDFKEKIEYVSLSPFEWSQNLIALAFKNKIIVGIIKFQEEFDDIEQEAEFEPVEEFYIGQRVHAVCWSPNSSLNKIPKQIEICSANNDFSLRVLGSDIATKRHSRLEIQGHSDYVNDCAYDLEGDYLASVSDDLTCKLWSVNQEFLLSDTFHLTSPGMCLSWRHEDPGKLLVGEKKGIIRLYNVSTRQCLNCIMCGFVPLTGVSWSLQSKLIAILAAGELLITNLNAVPQPLENKMIHPGGGYRIALSNTSDNYVATAGRPGNTLKIIHVKNKQAVVSANIEERSYMIIQKTSFGSSFAVYHFMEEEKWAEGMEFFTQSRNPNPRSGSDEDENLIKKSSAHEGQEIFTEMAIADRKRRNRTNILRISS